MNKLSLDFDTSKHSGFSLVELMVGLIIGLLMSLAIYSVFNVSESKKRTTVSLNDINQSGSYALYQLDKLIRSAGSGFTGGSVKVGADYTYGCRLDMARGGAQLTPSGGFLSPFNAVNPTVRVAPVIIYDGGAGAGGDVIVSMSGSAGLAESPTSFSALPSASVLNLTNHAGVRANDIVLLADKAGANISPCLIQQVSPSFIQQKGGSAVNLSGLYAASIVNSRSVTDYLETAQVINLGTSPSFNMFAVGANNSLMKYDLMQIAVNDPALANANPSLYVDGIYQMHAIYGVDNDGDAGVASLTWVAPVGIYSADNLLNGSIAANSNIKTIKAIKIALIVRTALIEKEVVSNATVKLFEDTAIPVTVNLADTKYRYNVFEATIPTRNTLILR
jgi:type IV pilus assembly protein PilW